MTAPWALGQEVVVVGVWPVEPRRTTIVAIRDDGVVMVPDPLRGSVRFRADGRGIGVWQRLVDAAAYDAEQDREAIMRRVAALTIDDLRELAAWLDAREVTP